MTAGSIIVPTIIPLRAPTPGKPKSFVDSNTRIEIKSESHNVDIYYTMDGNKPAPFAALGTDRSTFKYRGPFTLPEGKVTLKAMATSKDGIRQSNVNTKVFEVEFIQNDVPFIQEDDDRAFQRDLQREKSKQRPINRPYRRAWNEEVDQLEAQMTDMRVGGSHHRPPPSMARFTSTRFHPTAEAISDDGRSELRSTYPSPDPYSLTTKLQKKTDFLRCVYCFSERPSDPYARYCGTCGNAVPPLPVSKLSPPEPGEMGVCVHCKSTVPLNTKTCIVCEASIPDQNTPQITRKLEQSKVCTFCGTGNPATLKTCILCEGELPSRSQAVESREFAPPVPPSDGQMRECSKCHRVNTNDARFCDWCGAKPSNSSASLTCSRCGAANNMYSEYCSSCGVAIGAPLRVAHNGTDPPAYWTPAAKLNMVAEPTPDPIYLKAKKPAVRTSQTQTVGLFYPSERELQKKRESEEEKLALERQMRDRAPLLTSISPGKGYWRKQLEHMTTHLKAEAQSNAEFRALIADTRMGKLTAVSVHEDGFELTLTASFSTRTKKSPYQAPPISGSRLLSDLTHRRRHIDSESDDSDERDVPSEEDDTPEKIKNPKPKKKTTKKESKLSIEDRKLLKEIGKNGDGRGEEILELITEGASPSVCTSTGTPALNIAVSNKHTDCIDPLIQSGADVNGQDKNGNTALHEAVNLGYQSKEIIEILISHGASLNVKNSKGQSPHDLAMRTGNDTATKIFMASIGQSQLNKLSKPSKSKPNIF